MLNESISVEAQEADEASVLSVYKRFTTARNSHPALYKGEMTEVTSPSNPIAVWTMTADGETVLVVHNFGGSETEIDLQSYKTSDCLVSNGECTPGSGTVTLGAYASAVFLQ
jgi:trehalose-6-phosphate hydrolase